MIVLLLSLAAAACSHTSPSSKGAALTSDTTGDDTLVLYLYDNSDHVYSENFQFFLQEGVAAHDGCQYIIVVPDTLLKGKVSTSVTPKLCTSSVQCCEMLSQKGTGLHRKGSCGGTGKVPEFGTSKSVAEELETEGQHPASV